MSSTQNVILDTDQYVKINTEYGSFLLQSHRDTVRIAFSDSKPAKSNTAFHELGGQQGIESVLTTPYIETFIWALATTDRAKLTITKSRANVPISIEDPIELNGGVPVNIQDQTSPPFDLYFIKSNGVATTIASVVTINDLTISLTSSVGFVSGAYVGIFHPAENRFYFGTQIGAPVGNNITLDTPIDFAFQPGDNVLSFSRNLNVDGSINTQIFEIQGPGGNASIDVTRVMIQITTSSAPSYTAFGNITGGLSKGIVLRRVNGTVRNIWNVKANLDFANLAYDFTTYVSTNPGVGVWGIAIRYTFNGQDKHGVAIRLSKNESLELWVQDDLSSLVSFRIVAQGHIVTD